MNRAGLIELLLRRAHFDGDAEHLDHLASIWRDDVCADYDMI